MNVWIFIGICGAFGAVAWVGFLIGHTKGFRAGDDFAANLHALSRKRPPVRVELRRSNGGYVFVVGQQWAHPDSEFVPELTSLRYENVLEADDAAKRFWPDCTPVMNRDHG